mgnify:CR=1 FL=1
MNFALRMGVEEYKGSSDEICLNSVRSLEEWLSFRKKRQYNEYASPMKYKKISV